jgi:hypothetical protein
MDDRWQQEQPGRTGWFDRIGYSVIAVLVALALAIGVAGLEDGLELQPVGHLANVRMDRGDAALRMSHHADPLWWWPALIRSKNVQLDTAATLLHRAVAH